MDISLVTGAVTAIKTARQIGSAALKLRDFNQFAATIAEMNDQLLKAQESLLAHNADMLELQQKHFEACEELRKLKQAATERNRYSLHEVSPGTFVYQVQIASDSSDTQGTGPLHYLCQPCFDKGTKSVLQESRKWGSIYLKCNVCDCEYDSGRRYPFSL